MGFIDARHDYPELPKSDYLDELLNDLEYVSTWSIKNDSVSFSFKTDFYPIETSFYKSEFREAPPYLEVLMKTPSVKVLQYIRRKLKEKYIPPKVIENLKRKISENITILSNSEYPDSVFKNYQSDNVMKYWEKLGLVKKDKEGWLFNPEAMRHRPHMFNLPDNFSDEEYMKEIVNASAMNKPEPYSHLPDWIFEENTISTSYWKKTKNIFRKIGNGFKRILENSKVQKAGAVAAGSLYLLTVTGNALAYSEPLNITNTPNIKEGDGKISGKNVVYSHHGDVFHYDIEKGETTKLASNDENHHYHHPDIYKDKVVWMMSNEENAEDVLYLKNLTTGSLEKITNESWDLGVFFNPSIWGNYVVWEVHDVFKDKEYIYGYSFENKTKMKIAEADSKKEAFVMPIVENNLAIWMSWNSSADNFDIYGRYLDTWEKLEIARPGNQTSPDVYFDGNSYKIVWLDDRNDTNPSEVLQECDIYIYDTLTKEEKRITDTPIYRRSSPLIDKEYIIWTQNDDTYFFGTFHILNTKTGKINVFEIDYYSDIDGAYAVDIDDYIVVFRGWKNYFPDPDNDYDLYLLDLLGRDITPPKKDEPPIVSNIQKNIEDDILNIYAEISDPDSDIENAYYKIIENGNVLKNETLNPLDGDFDSKEESVFNKVNVSHLDHSKIYTLKIIGKSKDKEGFGETLFKFPITNNTTHDNDTNNTNIIDTTGSIMLDYWPYVVITGGGMAILAFYLRKRKKKANQTTS